MVSTTDTTTDPVAIFKPDRHRVDREISLKTFLAGLGGVVALWCLGCREIGVLFGLLAVILLGGYAAYRIIVSTRVPKAVLMSADTLTIVTDGGREVRVPWDEVEWAIIGAGRKGYVALRAKPERSLYLFEGHFAAETWEQFARSLKSNLEACQKPVFESEKALRTFLQEQGLNLDAGDVAIPAVFDTPRWGGVFLGIGGIFFGALALSAPFIYKGDIYRQSFVGLLSGAFACFYWWGLYHALLKVRVQEDGVEASRLRKRSFVKFDEIERTRIRGTLFGHVLDLESRTARIRILGDFDPPCDRLYSVLRERVPELREFENIRLPFVVKTRNWLILAPVLAFQGLPLWLFLSGDPHTLMTPLLMICLAIAFLVGAYLLPRRFVFSHDKIEEYSWVRRRVYPASDVTNVIVRGGAPLTLVLSIGKRRLELKSAFTCYPFLPLYFALRRLYMGDGGGGDVKTEVRELADRTRRTGD